MRFFSSKLSAAAFFCKLSKHHPSKRAPHNSNHTYYQIKKNQEMFYNTTTSACPLQPSKAIRATNMIRNTKTKFLCTIISPKKPNKFLTTCIIVDDGLQARLGMIQERNSYNRNNRLQTRHFTNQRESQCIF